ncbi:gamma carbonic anhydrase family protein [Endozoicomonas lisbonensis]|uniref:Carbonic anhydrase/acetyltransferase-like protein (Isoleucine patch superfamily) n=1 Tax=Endozoicomonas lisbonensis TaxID=3120522 RepID=A0ABV2SHH3_9GAMM
MNPAIRTFKGKTPVTGKGVFIDPTALVIGDVVIGKDSSIWPMSVVRGDMNSIRIGERTSIQDGSVLHITHASHYNPKGHALTIGSDVTVGHSVTLHGCTLHDRCLIGLGSIVMDGAVVEEEVIVAAGCLVPPGKRLQSGFLYKGNPARMVRPLTEQEISFFSYSAVNYVKLKDEYIAEMN